MKNKWKTEVLGDVCEVSRGTTITQKDAIKGDIPVVAGGIEPTYFHNRANRPAGVISVSGSGANAGYVNYWSRPIFASDCSTVIPRDKDKLDVRFVFLALKELQDFISTNLRQGAAQPHVYARDIASLRIPVPSLAEQQRIVSTLNKGFDGIATAKANAEKNLQNARALFESHLQAIFTQRGEGWAETTLGEVCRFENGDRGKNYPNREEYVESGIPWINTGHIQPDGTLSESEMNFISQEKYESLRSGKIQPGDLVYCLRGATLGKTALVDPFTIGAVASSLVIIRPCDLLDRRFLYYFLTSPVGQGLIKLYDNGAAQPNLGAKSVAKYKISLPQLSEQKGIVQKLVAIAAETQHLESIYRRKLAALDELKKSLLHKAFTGEL